MTDLQKERSAAARAARNEAQADLYREKRLAINAARTALDRLTATDDVTSAQLLEAMKTLTEIVQAR